MKVYWRDYLRAFGCAWPMLLGALMASPAAAQGFPTKPVSLIIPVSAGGSNDAVGRIFADLLGKRIGQNVVVLNQPGRDGLIGTVFVARANPDGYTLLFADASPFNFAPLMREHLPYDPVKDFVPIGMFMYAPAVFAAHPDAPFTTLAQLISYAKANPTKVRMAAGSTVLQAAAEMLNYRAGIKIQVVPYKGGGPATVDAVGGHVETLSSGVATVDSFVQSRRLRALAVASPSRAKALPDTPTMIESGFADFTAGTWFGILAPKGTPPEIVRIVSEHLEAVSKSEGMTNLAQKIGGTIEVHLREDFGRRIALEGERLAPVIKAAGLKADD